MVMLKATKPSYLSLRWFFFLGECPINPTAVHDDTPDNDDDACKKSYPRTSYGGWTYCFLFFCPQHGHCYGFHLVNGAEGRRDPFYAVLKFMPEPPKIIFYDFACSLHEYAMNREPGFFRSTEMYHDIFHGYGHVCPYAHQCANMEDKRCYNTSCAEQFNRYINKIKATARSLTLSRFSLYMQHMIYLYNKDKTAACKRQYAEMGERLF